MQVEISARTNRQTEVQVTIGDENNTGRTSYQQQAFDQVPTEILDSLKNSTMKP